MTPETPLCKLALTYWGCDKIPSNGGHSYTPYYYKLFLGRTPKRILEIGIDDGRGLRMWREYFPSVEMIHGLDGNPNLLFSDEKISTTLCYLNDINSIKRAANFIGGDLDIIIDDGSHVTKHQIDAANIFVPRLAPGGVYIIEDVQEAGVIVASLPYKCEVVEFNGNKRDLDDDRLVVIHAQ